MTRFASVVLGAVATFSATAAIFAISAGLAGCWGDPTCSGSGCSPPVAQDGGGGIPQPGFSSTIDHDQKMQDVNPGHGVGVFIEYAHGGAWHVYAACDWLVQQTPAVPCAYTIELYSASGISGASADGLTNIDQLNAYADGAEIVASIQDTTKGAYLTIPAGSPLIVQAFLDNVEDARLYYWISAGVVHDGAPGSPLQLTPSAP